jgi:hypothetical protein
VTWDIGSNLAWGFEPGRYGMSRIIAGAGAPCRRDHTSAYRMAGTGNGLGLALWA